MIRIILLFGFLNCLRFIFAEVAPNERMQSILDNLPKDSLRIDSLNEWALQHRYANLSLSISLAKMAGELALKSNNSEGYALSNYRLGLLYRMKEMPDSSVWHYRKALQNWQSTENAERIVNSLNAISKVYRMQGSYDSALFYGYKALEICRLDNDTANIAKSQTKIAIIYELTGEYDKAAEIHANNLELYKSIGDEQGIA
ncbi:MAG: tetratricopeptide repeat protein, partial [Bacteroidales bacterium]|nr:tetratricopeptide repeat protein [Bacteroidales bacterium]